MVCCNTCLVGKSFTQQPRIHYDETYSLMMDNITFQYLIGFDIFHKLKMRYGCYHSIPMWHFRHLYLYAWTFWVGGTALTLAQGTKLHIPYLHKITINSSHIDSHVSFTHTTHHHDTSVSSIWHTRHRLAIRVLKALYGMKQGSRVWYQTYTNEIILGIIFMGFSHDAIIPC